MRKLILALAVMLAAGIADAHPGPPQGGVYSYAINPSGYHDSWIMADWGYEPLIYLFEIAVPVDVGNHGHIGVEAFGEYSHADYIMDQDGIEVICDFRSSDYLDPTQECSGRLHVEVSHFQIFELGAINQWVANTPRPNWTKLMVSITDETDVVPVAIFEAMHDRYYPEAFETITAGVSDGDFQDFDHVNGQSNGIFFAGREYVINFRQTVDMTGSPSSIIGHGVGDMDIEIGLFAEGSPEYVRAVPEPAVASMFVPGVLLLGVLARRRAKR